MHLQELHDHLWEETEELAEEIMALFTWLIECWLMAIWFSARGSIKHFTNHFAAEIPGGSKDEPCTKTLSLVW